MKKNSDSISENLDYLIVKQLTRPAMEAAAVVWAALERLYFDLII